MAKRYDTQETETTLKTLTWQACLDTLGGSTYYACVVSGTVDDGLLFATDTGLSDVSEAEASQEFSNAKFVASSPFTVRRLLDELERLKTEREEFLAELYLVKAKLRESTAEATKLASALAAAYSGGVK